MHCCFRRLSCARNIRQFLAAGRCLHRSRSKPNSEGAKVRGDGAGRTKECNYLDQKSLCSVSPGSFHSMEVTLLSAKHLPRLHIMFEICMDDLLSEYGALAALYIESEESKMRRQIERARRLVSLPVPWYCCSPAPANLSRGQGLVNLIYVPLCSTAPASGSRLAKKFPMLAISEIFRLPCV